jgi:hypothetical protein
LRRHPGLPLEYAWRPGAACARRIVQAWRPALKKEVEMKIRLALIAACVGVVAAGAPATAQTKDEPVSQQNAHQMMTDDADASAQANTDMSYGGTPDTGSASGHRTGKVCWPRPQCDVFFGQ